MSATPSNPSLWLTVEVSPGSDISLACREAVALADKLSVTIWFDFNNVKCCARPGDDWQLLVANWKRQLSMNWTCKIACANPITEPAAK